MGKLIQPMVKSVSADISAQGSPESLAKRKVLVEVGTRPEAIKLLPLIRKVTDDRLIEPFVIVTG